MKTLEGKEKKKINGKRSRRRKSKEHRKRVLVLRRDISSFNTGKKEVLMGVDVPYLKIIHFLKTNIFS